MQINLDKYDARDKSLIINHTEEILKYGLQVYKKKHHIELTNTEKILYNIFVENEEKWLSKEIITAIYNERIYKSRTEKYIQPQNIVTKINRLNRKLECAGIANKYGLGYYFKRWL